MTVPGVPAGRPDGPLIPPLQVVLSGRTPTPTLYDGDPEPVAPPPSRVVTADLATTLAFSSTAPGGFHTATFDVRGDLGAGVAAFAPFTNVDIYDTRSGEQVWSGRLDVPGRTRAGAADSYQMSAVGNQVLADDLVAPVVYVDRRLDQWKKATTTDWTLQNLEVPDGTAGSVTVTAADGTVTGHYELTLPLGAYVVPGSTVTASYLLTQTIGQPVAYARAQLTSVPGNSPGGVAVNGVTATTQPQTVVAERGTGDPRLFQAVLTMAWIGSGRGPTQEVNTAVLVDLQVQGLRVGLDGVELDDAALLGGNAGTLYTYSDLVTTGEIVTDVVGRFLTGVRDDPDHQAQIAGCDPATAQVEASTVPLTQLAYEQGTTAATVLKDMMALEPDYFWAIWDRQSNGLAQFEWSRWPEAVAHDIPSGAFTSPGSAVDLYNQVQVRYVDPAWGATMTLNVSAPVPLLDAAGLVRCGYLDLGSQQGTAADAQAAGAAFLSTHNVSTNNGTATVSSPVLHRQSGRMLQPWQLRPGVLVRIRDLTPDYATLTASARDGSQVFRCTQTDYDSATNTCTLTLDGNRATVTSLLADHDRRLSGLVRY